MQTNNITLRVVPRRVEAHQAEGRAARVEEAAVGHDVYGGAGVRCAPPLGGVVQEDRDQQRALRGPSRPICVSSTL